MKLADIGYFGTYGAVSTREVRVGNWSYFDRLGEDGDERIVYHYGTEMGRFALADNVWYFVPTSVGWGSVSDQQGMNKILANYGWRYRRNGGNPRYERI